MISIKENIHNFYINPYSFSYNSAYTPPLQGAPHFNYNLKVYKPARNYNIRS